MEVMTQGKQPTPTYTPTTPRQKLAAMGSTFHIVGHGPTLKKINGEWEAVYPSWYELHIIDVATGQTYLRVKGNDKELFPEAPCGDVDELLAIAYPLAVRTPKPKTVSQLAESGLPVEDQIEIKRAELAALEKKLTEPEEEPAPAKKPAGRPRRIIVDPTPAPTGAAPTT